MSRRRPDQLQYNGGGGHPLPDDIQGGDYWKLCDPSGIPSRSDDPGNLTGTIWYVAAPMSYGFCLGALYKHTVREHEDGTISVRPGDGSSNSILVTGHNGEIWHGYIERGEFKAV